MTNVPPPPPSGSPYQQVVCPHCQASVTVMPTHLGQVIPCPFCAGNFQVPVPVAYSSAGNYGLGSGNPAVRDFAGKKIAAGICGIMLGGLGVHKFILGFNNAGAIMLTIYLLGLVTGSCLVVPLLAPFAIHIIGLVEGIIYLTKSDEEFYQTYAIGRKEWF